MKTIVSGENTAFKQIKKLAHSSREREKRQCILLDGFHLIEAYVARYGLPQALWVSESGLARREISDWLNRAQAAGLAIVLPDALFSAVSTLDVPTGILAVAALPSVDGLPRNDRDSVLLDGVQDPGNVGSILRSAAAAGFHQILLSQDCVQAWAPKTLRAAMGAHFHLEIYEAVDLSDFVGNYRGRVLATALHAETSLWQEDLKGVTAWVFGNEGQGVRQALLDRATRCVCIPMSATTESLNVAASAAICLFETVRQRVD